VVKISKIICIQCRTRTEMMILVEGIAIRTTSEDWAEFRVQEQAIIMAMTEITTTICTRDMVEVHAIDKTLHITKTNWSKISWTRCSCNSSTSLSKKKLTAQCIHLEAIALITSVIWIIWAWEIRTSCQLIHLWVIEILSLKKCSRIYSCNLWIRIRISNTWHIHRIITINQIGWISTKCP